MPKKIQTKKKTITPPDHEPETTECVICGEPNAAEECASCGAIVCEDCIVGDICDDCWEDIDEDDIHDD